MLLTNGVRRLAERRFQVPIRTQSSYRRHPRKTRFCRRQWETGPSVAASASEQGGRRIYSLALVATGEVLFPGRQRRKRRILPPRCAPLTGALRSIHRGSRGWARMIASPLIGFPPFRIHCSHRIGRLMRPPRLQRPGTDGTKSRLNAYHPLDSIARFAAADNTRSQLSQSIFSIR